MEEAKPQVELPILSAEELKTLGKNYDKFKVERKLSDGSTSSFVDEDAYLKSVGALSTGGAVVMDMQGTQYVRPTKYEMECHKLDQLKRYRAKVAYAKKKEGEAYEALAQEKITGSAEGSITLPTL